MKTIIIIAIVLFAVSAYADDVTCELDRVALLTPSQEDPGDYGSRIAVYFDIPDTVSGTSIVYAELTCPLDFSNVEVDGELILEFQAFNITSNWTDNADWDSPWTDAGGDIDSSTFYTYTLTMADTAHICMDVTGFVRDAVEGNATSYGMMLIPVKHDVNVYNIPQAFATVIENSAEVRIVYHSE